MAPSLFHKYWKNVSSTILPIFIFFVTWLGSTALQICPAQSNYLIDYQQISTEDGLASLYISKIFQDSRGFIWIGTRYGLNRYDGSVFELYTTEKNSLYANEGINYLAEDEKGNIWIYYMDLSKDAIAPDINTVAAIDVFNPITKVAISIESYFEDQPLPFRVQETLLPGVTDHTKSIWIITTEGNIFRYHDAEFQNLGRFSNSYIFALTTDYQNNLWIADDRSLLLRYDLSNNKVEAIDTLPGQIKFVFPDKKDGVWLCTARPDIYGPDFDFFRKREGQPFFRIFFYKDHSQISTQDRYELRAYRDVNGWWLMIINQKLYLFDSQRNFIQLPEKFSEIQISSHLASAKRVGDAIWSESGLGIFKYYVKPNLFNFIPTSDYPNCRGITEDQEGIIYLLNHELHQFNPKDKSVNTFHKVNGVGHLLKKDSLILTGAFRTQFLFEEYNLANNQLHYYRDSMRRFPYSSLPIAENRFLVATSEGLVTVDLSTKQIADYSAYNEFDYLADAEINYIYKNERGIWLATSQGLHLMNEKDGVLQAFNVDSGDLPFNNLRHLMEDEDGSFWLATVGGGLIHWKPDFEHNTSYFDQFTTKEGLSYDYLYAVYADDFGNLWLPSDRGLMCFSKETNNVRTYSVEDGLPHQEFNHTSHYQAKDGTFYFGTLGGFFYFHPKDLVDDLEFDAPIRLTHVFTQEDNKDGVTDRTATFIDQSVITIQPSDKFLEIHFAMMDFDEEEKHRYLYQIEGYSNSWNSTNGKVVRITNLPYGSYTLKIKGQNLQKGWSESILSLAIEVPRPFYVTWWFFTFLTILMIIGVYLYIKWREQQLQKEKIRLEEIVAERTIQIRKDKQTIEQQAEDLKTLDKAKTRFFSNITHELRTPLTLIIGPLEQIIKKHASLPVFSSLINILNNAKQLEKLINQLLDLSKLESGRMKIEVHRGDIVRVTRQLVNRIEVLAGKKNIQLNFICEKPVWKTNFDNEKWNKIVINLLSNAIKFTPRGGKVDLYLSQANFKNKDGIKLIVKDAGIGIDQDKIQKIFDRFYQVDGSNTRLQEGTGIGLSLIKELTELQGGEIKVDSVVDEGTTFEINLPILPTERVTSLEGELPPADLVIPIEKPVTKLQEPAVFPTNEEVLEVLIIEDNAEMRAYLKSCMDQKKYRVTEAVDGIDGIEKAKMLIPDLIISDVMMPRTDGFEVTKTVRENLATSHVPLILLTAKASLESRLEGLSRGADAYLTKPFSPQELTLRMQKLIELRHLMQRRYKNGIPETDLENADSDIFNIIQQEDEFITNLRNYILENLEYTNLNGDVIGKHFYISRSHLHRKLKALTGKSTTEFVKTIRLFQARKYLLARKHNVSEIAYLTGFSSPEHFSKVFKKEFGKAPSKF